MAHVEDFVRDAAQQKARGRLSGMRTHHDQVGLKFLGTLENDGRRRSNPGDGDRAALNGRQTGGNIFGKTLRAPECHIFERL